MSWTNDDGLYIKYGVEEAEVAAGGALNYSGETLRLFFTVDWSQLEAFGTVTYLSDTVAIPAGAYLKSATFYVDEAFVGSGATLTFGTYRKDARATEIDADGIDATIAVTAIDAVADTITCDGADIATVVSATYAGLVTATVGTANFTAGRGRLVIDYYTPYTPQE